MNYNFKNLTLSEADRLWMNEVYANKVLDVRVTKAKLWARLPKDFDPNAIDTRLFRRDHLTLVGIWHIDPDSKVFDQVDRVIRAIREQIVKAPGMDTVSAKDIAALIGISERETEIAFYLMSEMGHFFSSASGRSEEIGYTSITFNDDNGYDAYLAFENIESLMEQFFNLNAPSQQRPPTPVFREADRYDKDTAFIIMAIDPENPELEDVCNTIKETCAKFGITAQRADDIQHQESITDVVLQQIRQCEFLIADLSYERPNVYYEVGYAHALGKRPILSRKQGMKLHFDLSVHNVIDYKNMSEFKAKLITRFEAILGKNLK